MPKQTGPASNSASNQHEWSAAFALSNGIDDYLQREPEDEKSLIKSEADMVNGQARVRQLDDHIEHFCRLLQLLRARMSEGLLKRAPPPTDLDDR
jgi:hypothetical protein